MDFEIDLETEIEKGIEMEQRGFEGSLKLCLAAASKQRHFLAWRGTIHGMAAKREMEKRTTWFDVASLQAFSYVSSRHEDLVLSMLGCDSDDDDSSTEC